MTTTRGHGQLASISATSEIFPRDMLKTKGLIAITVFCCFLIMFLPNFDVLPDRRRKPSSFFPVTDVQTPVPHCVLPRPTYDEDRSEAPASAKEFTQSLTHQAVSYTIDENYKLHVSAPKTTPNFTCKYQRIHWSVSPKRFWFSGWSGIFTRSIKLSNRTEHLRLYCVDNSSNLLADYFLSVPPRFKLEAMSSLKQQGNDSFSVLLISLSGITKKEFATYMRRTYAFVKMDVPAVSMLFHSQHVSSGWHTLIYLLTGRPLEDVKPSTRPSGFLEAEFIWETYNRRGYVTYSTEDQPQEGLLNVAVPRERHTQFSSLPLVQAYQHVRRSDPRVGPCLGSERSGLNFHSHHAMELFETSRDRPVFAFMRFSDWAKAEDGCQDRGLDDDLATFLYAMRSKGHLNRTLLIVMSDSVKDLPPDDQPMLPLYISLPPEFANRFPTMSLNLKENAVTITSHIDVHATLLDLVTSGAGSKPAVSHGQSLFQRITIHRPCEMILVSKPMCFCLPRD
ncbi:hypothetical protein Btru_054691 [Bulinus truncatus]|nr:hypothetical protein Btru_054691 [Bulinus truncatus]